jgi:hypothetical protein
MGKDSLQAFSKQKPKMALVQWVRVLIVRKGIFLYQSKFDPMGPKIRVMHTLHRKQI